MITMETLVPSDEGRFPYLLTGIASVGGLVFFKTVSPALSTLLCEPYRRLPKLEKATWNSNMLTLVMAAISGTLSMYGLLFDDAVNTDKVWGTSQLVKVTVAMIVGYMLSHLVAYTILEPGIFFGWVFVIHHIIAIIVVVLAGINRTSSYLFYLGGIFEFTNIFLSIHLHLEAIDYKKSSILYISNGVAFFISNLFIRILTIPIYFHNIYVSYSTDWGRHRDHVFAFVVLASVSVTLFNCYYFRIILMEVINFLFKKSENNNHNKDE